MEVELGYTSSSLGPVPYSQEDREKIQRELALILDSPQFRGSRRCQDFLNFVVAQTLEGHSDTLKERGIAIEVFGRKADADLEEDSIVRVGAREVRKRLAQYYLAAAGSEQVRIELPPGNYIPVFHLTPHVEPVEPAFTPVHETPATPAAHRSRRKLLIGAVGIAAVALVAVLLLLRSPKEFDTFWEPVFHAQSRVMILLAHPTVFHPTDHARAIEKELHPQMPNPWEQPLEVPPERLTGSDFVAVKDTYVGLGDGLALFRLGALFERHAQNARVRLASKVEFPDLRDSATILIGAYTNRWSMSVSKDLPFRFANCSMTPCILAPDGKQNWKIGDFHETGRSNDDYILISRLPRSSTGNFAVICAGLTQSGTDEAGRILCDTETLTPILKHLPRGWNSKNLQLLLHSKVIGETTAPPQLVASKVW